MPYRSLHQSIANCQFSSDKVKEHLEICIAHMLTSSLFIFGIIVVQLRHLRPTIHSKASGLQTMIELSLRNKSVCLHFHLHLFTSTSHVLTKTRLHSIRQAQNAESMKPAFCQLACLPLAFLLTLAIFFSLQRMQYLPKT